MNVEEWIAVMKISLPVILLDETMKFIARKFIDGKRFDEELAYMILTWLAYFALVLYFHPFVPIF